MKNKKNNGQQLYKDFSTSLRMNETGFVDKIYTDRNADGFRFVKIRMRTERIPIIGDKFASRSGQKGTIGMIIPGHQMPFTKDGIRPDIIVNPHAIPSRMTIGHLVECVYAKLCCMEGYLGDGTTFINLETASPTLRRIIYVSGIIPSYIGSEFEFTSENENGELLLREIEE